MTAKKMLMTMIAAVLIALIATTTQSQTPDATEDNHTAMWSNVKDNRDNITELRVKVASLEAKSDEGVTATMEAMKDDITDIKSDVKTMWWLLLGSGALGAGGGIAGSKLGRKKA